MSDLNFGDDPKDRELQCIVYLASACEFYANEMLEKSLEEVCELVVNEIKRLKKKISSVSVGLQRMSANVKE